MFKFFATASLLLSSFITAEAAFQPMTLTIGSPLMLADGASVACGTGLEIAREQGFQNVRILTCKSGDGFDYFTGFKTEQGKVTPLNYWIRISRDDGALASILAPVNSGTATATGRNS